MATMLEHGHDISTSRSFNDMLRRMGAAWNTLTTDVLTPDGHKIPNRRAIVRSDNRKPLGVVSDRYKVVHNSQLLRPVAALVAETRESANPVRLVRGGVCDDGAKVWLRATVGDPVPVGDAKLNDVVRCDVSVTATHDGSGATRIRLVPLRLVCLNGMVAAGGGGSVSIVHRGDVDKQLEAYRDALRQLAKSWDQSMRAFNALASARVQAMATRATLTEIVREYVAAVFGRDEIRRQLENDGETPRVRAVRDAYYRGRGNSLATARSTGWGLYQALTDHLTHGRAVNDRRYLSLVDGGAARHNERGLEVAYARAVCGVRGEALLDPDSSAMRDVRRALAA